MTTPTQMGVNFYHQESSTVGKTYHFHLNGYDTEGYWFCEYIGIFNYNVVAFNKKPLSSQIINTFVAVLLAVECRKSLLALAIVKETLSAEQNDNFSENVQFY